MNKGDINKLLISKQNKINKVKKGYPAQKEGRDGDLQVRIVPNKGLFLFYKWGNTWYGSRLERINILEHPVDERRLVPYPGPAKKTGEITRVKNFITMPKEMDASTTTSTELGSFGYNHATDGFSFMGQLLYLNSTNSGDGAPAVFGLIAEEGSDAYLSILDGATPRWKIGMDDSDSHNLIFSTHASYFGDAHSDGTEAVKYKLKYAAADAATQFNLFYNSTNYAFLACASGGRTTLQSVSSATEAADIWIIPDGDMIINRDSTKTASSTNQGLEIDLDHTGITASGQSIYNKGLVVNLNSDAPTHVGNVYNTGIQCAVTGNAHGNSQNTGLTMTVSGADTNKGIYVKADTEHLRLVAGADNSDYATFTVADTGDLTIATVGDGTTDSDLTLDVDGSIILDSADGGFELHGAGSTAKFADLYAGTILAYTDIGLNESHQTYDLTTSYAVPDDEFKVTFVIPPSGNVLIEVQIQHYNGSSGIGDLYAGLSTASATSGYTALASYHEKPINDLQGRGAVDTHNISWTLTGLTPGDTEEIWAGFKAASATGTPKLRWGGAGSDRYPDFIMKAIALPATIAT